MEDLERKPRRLLISSRIESHYQGGLQPQPRTQVFQYLLKERMKDLAKSQSGFFFYLKTKDYKCEDKKIKTKN